MPRAERDKGARGEREVAAIFRANGFNCDRVPSSGGLRLKGDLYGDVPAHIEVKRQERLQLWQWLAQADAERAPGAVPVVVFRRNASGWYACLPLDDFLYFAKRNRCRYCGRETMGVDVCAECVTIASMDEAAK